MPSSKFRDLSRRLTKLKNHLLPSTFSSTGTYEPRQLDRAMGYRLLVHAELESYLEDRARLIVNTAVKNWTNDHKPKPVLHTLLSFHLGQDPASHHDLKEEYSGKKNREQDAVKAASQGYNHMLSRNNGIREDSVLKILLPLGIKPSDIDQTWLNTMDSFGFARGLTAHSSLKVQQPLDPKTEFDTVNDILKGLRDIDESLNKIKT